LLKATNSKAKIEIDGGVNQENAPNLIASGAHVLVAGNFVFTAARPKEVIQQLKSLPDN